MYRILSILYLFLLLIITGCTPISNPVDEGRVDRALIGTWYRDDDSSGDLTLGDEKMIFMADGRIICGDYLDPDGGAKPIPPGWFYFTLEYTWLNGYYEDNRTNAWPNNYVRASLLGKGSNGNTFLIDQYRYTSYPTEVEILKPDPAQNEIWTHQ